MPYAEALSKGRLILIRHGESEHALRTVIAGRQSCRGLSEQGLKQAELLAHRLVVTHEVSDCQHCPLSYPLRDGVPVLVMKQASTRKVETSDEFERLISEALQAPFSGWDFSWLEGRLVQTAGPHGELDYERCAREVVAKASAVLDQGTGGGELLSKLAPFPPIAIATEAYPPNVVVAARRLAPLGVKIICTDGGCHDSRGPQPRNRWPRRRHA